MVALLNETKERGKEGVKYWFGMSVNNVEPKHATKAKLICFIRVGLDLLKKKRNASRHKCADAGEKLGCQVVAQINRLTSCRCHHHRRCCPCYLLFPCVQNYEQ